MFESAVCVVSDVLPSADKGISGLRLTSNAGSKMQTRSRRQDICPTFSAMQAVSTVARTKSLKAGEKRCLFLDFWTKQCGLPRLDAESSLLGHCSEVIGGDDPVDIEQRFDLPFDLGHAKQV